MSQHSTANGPGVRRMQPDLVQAPAEYFEGRVEWESVLDSRDVGLVQVRVHFHDGGRTRWHVHAGDQVLYFVEGRGMAQKEGGPVLESNPGDIVHVLPGTIHRHGAAEGASAVHVAITVGETVWEGDPNFPGA